MNESKNTSPVFYGWWIVFASFTILLIGCGIGVYSFPIFLGYLSLEFEWSRAAVVTAGSISFFAFGGSCLLAGILVDRYGPKIVLNIGALVMIITLLLLSLVEYLWQLYVLYLCLGLGTAFSSVVPNVTIISNWFIKRRGLATGLILTGIGAGGFLLPIITDSLIYRFGWQKAYIGLGLLMLVVVFLTVTLIRHKPEEMGLLPDGGLKEEIATLGGSNHSPSRMEGLNAGEAMRILSFWMLCVANFLFFFGGMVVVQHLPAFLRGVGFSPGFAARALGFLIFMTMFGRVTYSFIADRFQNRYLYMTVGLLHIVGVPFLIQITVDSSGLLLLFVILVGFAVGGMAVMYPLIVYECFGPSAPGKLLGFTMMFGSIGGALGPIIAGHIFDITQSYRLAFIMVIIIHGLGVAAVSFVRPRSQKGPLTLSSLSPSSG